MAVDSGRISKVLLPIAQIRKLGCKDVSHSLTAESQWQADLPNAWDSSSSPVFTRAQRLVVSAARLAGCSLLQDLPEPALPPQV